jgi:hypothetical protein
MSRFRQRLSRPCATDVASYALGATLYVWLIVIGLSQ